MSKIKKVQGKEILDSRGRPTVEVTCALQSGEVATASVPSGASTGGHEALEKRDNDKNRFGGLGVLGAVNNVNEEINNYVTGKDFNQRELDETLIKLDGTENKSRLGANAILGVSLAFARAVAKEKKLQLYEYLGTLANNKEFRIPQPMFNIINGGKHSDSGLQIQEFLILPIAFKTVREKVRAAEEIISALEKLLKKDGYSTSLGDEGGFAPKLLKNEDALKYIGNAIKEAGYDTEKIKMGMDAAASQFYKEKKYEIRVDGEKKKLGSAELIN
ncbi:MAG: phosphopyruvate hydratase, partial [Minisyncoccia bacterium]